MKVGGRRRITIPPHLAYGKRGAGGVIGPDETLVFVVDLIGVRSTHRPALRLITVTWELLDGLGGAEVQALLSIARRRKFGG